MRVVLTVLNPSQRQGHGGAEFFVRSSEGMKGVGYSVSVFRSSTLEGASCV